jgi:Predicted nucleotide-binding protein containing TIR-like domain
MRPRIFIGSSSEGLDIAKKVKNSLKGDFDCVIWNDGPVFGLGTSYLDSLLKAGSMFDFGILVTTKDDKTKSRDKLFASPRDNVVFEYGLFMGRLGKFRTLILREEGAKLPSDIEGIHISRYIAGKRRPAPDSLETQIDTIREHIRERSQLPELGLLPSTGVAMGYYSNFVGRVSDYLRLKEKEKVGGVTYSSFEVQVVIPKTLERKMQDRATEYFKANGFTKHTFVPADGREIKTQIAADKEEPAKLLICDVPTTLTPLYDAIELYLQKGHLGKSNEQKLIEARELNNFLAVLKTKVMEDNFSKKVVRFIDEETREQL